ncbi:MAG: hypothetical protein [psittacine adenovirus 7]|uniref:Uncharacterized protein n=1 Tax=psittacine adenovirus 7 TaxID=2848040 RepID=A0A6B9LRD7_9ADEN|nr:MAG: hypothetical protein QKN13_gp22 [psittacine adenovirus 7]QHB43561.1 MAG: hypothetical protein [psittacine adenovirus 7]
MLFAENLYKPVIPLNAAFAKMPLTWWLQADTHFDEENPNHLDLCLTLQAYALERKEENKVTINIHKEIEPELNAIYDSQIDTWLGASMVKTAVFTTGKGDILLRQLFATAATSFVEAECAGKHLRSILEKSYREQFGDLIIPGWIKVSLLAHHNSPALPTLRTDVNKPLVLLIATEDAPKYAEFSGNEFSKEFVFHLRDYTVKEVQDELTEYYELQCPFKYIEETPDNTPMSVFEYFE